MSQKTNKFVTLGSGSVSVKLSKPVGLNGVLSDTIVMREPTIGDMRKTAKLAKDDAGAQEIFLFANLAGCSPQDIEQLSVKDYSRLQEGYFRLVRDDEDAWEGSAEDNGTQAIQGI